MPERAPPPDPALAPLDALAAWAADRRPPPVDSWDPPSCGDSGIRIAGDGRWVHDGAPIRRPEMVRLFASILRRDAEGYVLVTPVEKLAIAVDDLPFVATALRTEGAGRARRMAMVLSVDEAVIVDAAHPIRIDGDGRPSILVRDGLLARISRPVWYELAALAIGEGGDPPGLWSAGAFFALAGAA